MLSVQQRFADLHEWHKNTHIEEKLVHATAKALQANMSNCSS